MSAKEINERKFREMIKYISMRSLEDKYFGATKLNKILFYCDFIAYKDFGESISGSGYRKGHYGPAPNTIPKVLKTMIEEKEMIEVPRPFGSYMQRKPVALQVPDLDMFSPKEISLIDGVIEQFAGMSASDVSDLSHEFIGWQAARMGEDIPYETVLLEEHEITEEEKEYGRSLMGMAEEMLAR
ncbi:MAG: Panacea domain-containing protein [Candidatus Omnitrophota bacterium]